MGPAPDWRTRATSPPCSRAWSPPPSGCRRRWGSRGVFWSGRPRPATCARSGASSPPTCRPRWPPRGVAGPGCRPGRAAERGATQRPARRQRPGRRRSGRPAVRPAEPGAADSAPPPAAVAETFAGWLATRRLSARTRATYAQRVGQFLAWLAAGGGGEVAGDPLGDSESFTDAARDWRRELLATRAAPATVNLSLTALGAPSAGRGRGAPVAAHRAACRVGPGPGAAGPAVRDRAAAGRGGGARRRRRAHHRSTGAVPVRAGKGERPRTVPLPVDARTQLRRWLSEREQHPAGRPGEPALWLGRRGRLSPRQLQRVVTPWAPAPGWRSAHTPCGTPRPPAGCAPGSTSSWWRGCSVTRLSTPLGRTPDPVITTRLSRSLSRSERDRQRRSKARRPQPQTAPAYK